jgi:lysophospholipase L1-like esterase
VFKHIFWWVILLSDNAFMKIKVACVGDSITQGVGTILAKSYPKQLGIFLGSEFEVGNFGISGATMLRGGDKPYSQQLEYQEQFPPLSLLL